MAKENGKKKKENGKKKEEKAKVEKPKLLTNADFFEKEFKKGVKTVKIASESVMASLEKAGQKTNSKGKEIKPERLLQQGHAIVKCVKDKVGPKRWHEYSIDENFEGIKFVIKAI